MNIPKSEKEILDMQANVMCENCVHFNSYQDGEEQAQFGEMAITSLEWVYECGLNCRAFKNGAPTSCKRFRPHKAALLAVINP